MSKHSKLSRRNGRYYFRTRVPADLISTLGKKEIKKSLGTSDYREALKRLSLEQLKAEELFTKTKESLCTPPQHLHQIDLIDIEKRVTVWHHDKCSKQAHEDDLRRVTLTPEEVTQEVEALREELSAFDGGHESQYAASIQAIIEKLFPTMSFAATPKDYMFAQSLVHQSTIEQIYKKLERHGEFYQRVPFLRFTNDVTTPIKAHSGDSEYITLDSLISKFKSAKRSDGLTDKTIDGYKLTFDFALELFSPARLVSKIKAEDCRRFRDELTKLPANAKKRYPNLTLMEATKEGSKRLSEALSTTSVNGNLQKLSSLFNFAVREGFIDSNPCEHVPSIKQKKEEV